MGNAEGKGREKHVHAEEPSMMGYICDTSECWRKKHWGKEPGFRCVSDMNFRRERKGWKGENNAVDSSLIPFLFFYLLPSVPQGRLAC